MNKEIGKVIFLLVLAICSSCTFKQGEDTIATTVSTVATAADSAFAFSIDSYINTNFPTSPLKGYGARFVYWGRDQDIDPRLIVAIGRQESRLATDPNACNGNATKLFNAWGMLQSGQGCIDLKNWDTGIESATKNIVKNYIKFGLDTVAKIAPKYCQSGCNDWRGNVAQFVTDLLGDPNNLTFPFP